MADSPDSQSSSNGIAGLPTWAKVIAQVGIPGAVILLILYFLLPVWVKQGEASLEALPRIEQKIDSHIKATESLEMAVEKGSEEQHEHGLRLENYMRLLCVNSSTSTEERNTCLSVR